MKKTAGIVAVLFVVSALFAAAIIANMNIQLKYKKAAEEAFRNSGKGGHKASEVIDSLNSHYGIETNR